MPDTQTILIVDDEPVLRSLLEDDLTNEGFRVETADCARTALERVRERRYQLVILDLALPDMNGILLCQKIQQNHPELKGKIIFITGIGLDESTTYHLRHLAGAYLAKPFELNSLNRTVRSLLAANRAPAPEGAGEEWKA